MKTRTRATVVVAASFALATSLALPAEAAVRTFEDKRGEIKGGFDIQAVKVRNTGPWVTVKTYHRNLKYGENTSGGGVSVYLDIARERKGPEFVLSGPVGFDGDFSISKARRWKQVGDPLRCPMRFRVDYGADVVTFAAKRRCLDRTYDHKVGKVWVAAKASQNRKSGGKPMTDWAPKRRTLYPAVKRG